MDAELRIDLNGKPHTLAEKSTLLELLRTLPLQSLDFGVAACVNGEVIEKERWPQHMLSNGDRIDVLQAFQGG